MFRDGSVRKAEGEKVVWMFSSVVWGKMVERDGEGCGWLLGGWWKWRAGEDGAWRCRLVNGECELRRSGSDWVAKDGGVGRVSEKNTGVWYDGGAIGRW